MDSYHCVQIQTQNKQMSQQDVQICFMNSKKNFFFFFINLRKNSEIKKIGYKMASQQGVSIPTKGTRRPCQSYAAITWAILLMTSISSPS